jgi:4-hydroxy-tetrahydrodipicolinate synthase
MCGFAVAGDRTAAEKVDATLAGLHKKLFVEANPIPAKWSLYKLGLIEEGIRLPLTWLSSRYHADVESAMRQAGVI